jgi:hypothetical protein
LNIENYIIDSTKKGDGPLMEGAREARSGKTAALSQIPSRSVKAIVIKYMKTEIKIYVKM